MDFNFTEEQTMIRDSLSRLIREQYDFDTRREVINSESGWRPDMWATFAELGLNMAPFSEEDGGLGGGPIDAMVVMEEFGKGLVIEPYLPSVVCAGTAISKGGSAAQKEEFLAGIMSGEAVFAYAWSEPRGRYNPAHLETTAKADGGDYVLNGHKAVVICAPWASHFVVSARTGGSVAEEGGVSVFIVAKDADGVSTRDYPTVDGRRASEVYFENVRVPADHLIGEDGGALSLLETVNDYAVAALCAEACGAMGIAHTQTVEYSKQRKQFGVPIGKFQVLQHRMVDMFMEHEQSISMTYMANLKLDEDVAERQKSVSAAKTRISQAAKFVGQEAVQIHGGMGVTDELAVGHYFKRLTIIENEFGGIDHHMRRFTRLTQAELPAAAE